MALDFYKLDSKEHLFKISEEMFDNLAPIFKEYQNWTGVFIDQYGRTKLAVENQETLIKIIDSYIDKTNLNADKRKSVDILEFKEMMKYFSEKQIDFEVVGD